MLKAIYFIVYELHISVMNISYHRQPVPNESCINGERKESIVKEQNYRNIIQIFK